MEPEDRQGLRHYALGGDKVCPDSMQRKAPGGFMEAALGEDIEEEQAVPKQGSGIEIKGMEIHM